MRFYLGTHMPSWLALTDVPLFVSRRRLGGRKTFPRALGAWALDSGGFTELQKFGGWRVTPQQYATDVRRYREEIGKLDWAAPQDWMCEPVVINGGWAKGVYFVGTHLSVQEHQRRTIENYLTLRDLAPDLPFVPVLQGWKFDDYRRHIDAYAAAGIDLRESVVGLGSVCRRQHTGEIRQIIEAITTGGLRLHGFGVKTTGLATYGQLLTSADSMSWSYRGRRVRPPECGSTTHSSEANCMTFALRWRSGLLYSEEVPDSTQLGLDLWPMSYT